MAGNDRGTYFIPQKGDEVLVAFNQGDARETYVIGCLWNGQDAPPTKEKGAPTNVRMIRTPKGHEIKINDEDGCIQIKNADGGFIKLTSSAIELTIESKESKESKDKKSASIKLDNTGDITIKASGTLKLEAESIDIDRKDKAIGTLKLEAQNINIGCEKATAINIGGNG